MNQWFRFYTGVVDDPKAQMLSPEMFKHWVNVLCIAGQNDGELPSIKDVAFKLRLAEPKAAGVLAKLAAAGLLDKTEKGFKPHNWDGRQYKHSEGAAGTASNPKGRYVYFVAPPQGAPIKIGISNNPWARIGELQTGYPDKLSIVATFKTTDPSEAELHDILSGFRRQNEWFDLPASVMDVVTNAHASKSNYSSLVLLLRSQLRPSHRSSSVAPPEQNRADQIDVAADAPAPKPSSLTRNEAWDLAEQLLVIAGHDPAFWPPGWCGAPMRVQTWLNQGWPAEIILAATKAAAARKHGAPANSVQFFERAIAEEVARQAAPVPQVEVRQQQTLTVISNEKTRPNSVAAAARRFAEQFESQSSDGGDSNSAALLRLPAR